MYTPTRGAAAASPALPSASPSSPFRTPVRRRADAHLASPSDADYLLDSDALLAPAPPGSAFASRGKWFNPDAQRVLDDRVTHMSERQSTMRLRWNVASLIVLAWCLQTGMYRQIKGVTLAAGIPLYAWSLLEWFGLAVLFYNTAEAVWCLLRPQNQYTNFAMTPSQRLRIGLDSRLKSTARDTPITPPRMTPSRSPFRKQTPASVTDIDSRRRTPVKGGASTTSAAGCTTPRILRSPVSLATGFAHNGYSADSDALTLTQVLKKIPGASSITDHAMGSPTHAGPPGSFVLGTPPMFSAHDDLNISTPRLPVSRYAISDMAVATPLQQHLRAQPTIGLYQTAAPVSRAIGSEGSKGLSKDRAVGDVEYLEPHEVLEKYSAERDILDWVEKMHTWFVRHLLRPLCKQIDELDELFEQHGLGHLSCRRTVLDAAALEQAKSAAATSAFAPSSFGSMAFGGGFASTAASSFAQGTSATPQTLVDLALKYGDLPQTKERMALEKYLLIPGYNCRDYIVQRVHTLAQSVALPAYVFDGGGSYAPFSRNSLPRSSDFEPGSAPEQPWNPALHPTDAQLLFHLFCTFMDQTLPPVQNSRHPFTDRYVMQPDRKSDHNLPVQIIQVVRKRPHFCLIVKGSFYDVTANRNNLFITLILFVLEIQRECAGYLGLTNLGGKHVDLLAVVAK